MTNAQAPIAAGPLEASVSVLTLRLVTYGLGEAYDPEKFAPIKNRLHTKPFGGLWASPVDSAYGWREWCEAENWGDLSTRFETEYTGRTLVIDSAEDLAKVIWQDVKSWRGCPDYEAMQARGVDAIYLTERGEHETRFTEPGLYGYDCECVIVMNRACLMHANEKIQGDGQA